MNYSKFILLVTIIVGIYSCDSGTSPQQRPINYTFEDPYFYLQSGIPYNYILNRIDIGHINNRVINKNDSGYVRGMFYDHNELFRDIGDLKINNNSIAKKEADSILGIQIIIKELLSIGYGFYESIEFFDNKDELVIKSAGYKDFPKFEYNIRNLDTLMNIKNLNELDTIDITKGFDIITNDIGYDNFRVRIYNSNDEKLLYGKSNDAIKINEGLGSLKPGKYNIEVIKGHYHLDTLENNEYLIVNLYSSFIFESTLK